MGLGSWLGSNPAFDTKLGGFLFLEQEKLKEKKQSVADPLKQTLQTMYKAGCLNLVDVIEGKSHFILDFMKLY